MATKDQLFSLYTGPKDAFPKPGDYIYHFMQPLFPIIQEWSIDDFGSPVLVLKESVELTRVQIVEIFCAVIHGDVFSCEFGSNDRLRFTIS
ncbi:unnamed protein product [marine sediment metagenome]|uniref:Uncharacterized protein n=1 Tax=marine sediment metagenome TaxID=412755 RepID=X1FXC9_9ZZZZ